VKKFIKSKTFLLAAAAAVLVVIFVAGCNKLDLKPLDKVSADSYYKTSADFDGAIFAAYSSIQDLWGTSTETLGERGEFWAITLAATDDVDINTKAGGQGDLQRAKDLNNLLFRADAVPFASIYTQVYKGIFRANLVIENVDNGRNSLTAGEKTQFVAEAKFLRAFFHFIAVQMWGTPPLVTTTIKSVNETYSNATSEALYAAILKDLQDANAGLPDAWDASNLGRANKWTARAFEGKVNVWHKDWPAAITAFEEVKNTGPYDLFNGNANPIDNYEDAFDFKKENGLEGIFEVQYGGPFSDDNIWVFDDTHSENFKASQGTGRPWYWDASSDAGAPGGGMGWYVPSQNLVNEFEAGDPRLGASIYKAGDTYYSKGNLTTPFLAAWSSTGYGIRKYFGVRNADAAQFSPNDQAGYNNERFFRYSDMLLLYAEALVMNGQPGNGVNIVNTMVRSRVGLGPTTIVDPMAAIRHERRVEMAFEPGRWFDITRWNIGSTIFGAAWKDNYNVFPFPQSEITRNGGKLAQNPGY